MNTFKTLTAAAALMLVASAAHADDSTAPQWYIAHAGAETCVWMGGMTPADFARHYPVPLTLDPRSTEITRVYTDGAGGDGNFVFFSMKEVCQKAVAAMLKGSWR